MMNILILQIVLALGSLHETFATITDLCNGVGNIAKPSQPCTKSAVLFICVTPKLDFQDVNIDNVSKSNCNSSNKFIIVIHGLSENVYTSPWVFESARLLAQKKNLNVLIVNYLVCVPDYIYYFYGVLNINIPAQAIADIITALKATIELCYGHSLGGQVCGRLGQLLKINKILASDPAAPCFEGAEPSKRLDSSDALFLETVHTNIGLMGSKDTGHLDHYPNCGMKQPGCEAVTIDINTVLTTPAELLKIPIDTVFCSHRRGYQLILESLQANYVFCDSLVALPLPCPDPLLLYKNNCNTSTEATCNGVALNGRQPSTASKYYFATNGQSPYCMNKCPS